MDSDLGGSSTFQCSCQTKVTNLNLFYRKCKMNVNINNRISINFLAMKLLVLNILTKDWLRTSWVNEFKSRKSVDLSLTSVPRWAFQFQKELAVWRCFDNLSGWHLQSQSSEKLFVLRQWYYDVTTDWSVLPGDVIIGCKTWLRLEDLSIPYLTSKWQIQTF